MARRLEMLLGVAEPDPAALERRLADQVTAWREQHGDRIVYIGGTFHTAVATRRAMADTPTREPTNHRWLHDTDRIRFVGPGYDPHNDADHAMTGDPRTWFDILVHQKIATSVNFLT